MKYKLFLVGLLILGLPGKPVLLYSQTPAATPHPLIEWYRINNPYKVDEDNLRHRPLDGNVVSMIPVRKGSKYGFVKKETGAKVWDYVWDKVLEVFEEGAIVCKDGVYSFIDNNGKTVTKYSDFSNFQHSGKYYTFFYRGHIDTLSNEIRACNYVEVYDKKLKKLFSGFAHDFRTFSDQDTLAWFRYADSVTVFNSDCEVVRKFRSDPDKKFIGVHRHYLVFASGDNENTSYEYTDILNGKTLHFNTHEGLRYHFPIPVGDHLFAELIDGNITFYELNGRRYQMNCFYHTCLTEINKYVSTLGLSDRLFYSNHDFFTGRDFYSIPVLKHYIVEAYINDFSNDLMFGIFNDEGKMVLTPEYDVIRRLPNGEFLLNKKNEKYHLDRNLTLTLLPSTPVNSDWKLSDTWYIQNADLYVYYVRQFLEMREGYTGKDSAFCIQLKNIQTNEVRKLDKQIIYIEPFVDGLAMIMDKNYQLGFMDTTLKIVIPMKYRMYGEASETAGAIWFYKFKNGYCYIESKKGYIDTKGKEYFED